MKSVLKATTALVAAVSLLQPALLVGAAAQSLPRVTIQPNPSPNVAPYITNPDNLPDVDIIPLLQQRVKYVFVIFNENHSFDNEYGTFPGVNGIYSDGTNPRSPANTPGFTQTYTDVNNNTRTVQPFLLGPQQNSTFRDSVDHSHTGLAKKIDVVNGLAQMDQFSLDEYSRYAVAGNAASQKEGTEFARLVMSHIDCNTIPFFWQYASNFTIFDNIFATEDTPSSPNAIAMLAGQSGETQWVKHGPSGTTAAYNGTVLSYNSAGAVVSTTYSGTGTTQGPPIVNDPQPWWGSVYDTTVNNRQPNAPKESWTPTNIASNLTFASVPLTLMGNSITSYTNADLNPAFDLPDIQQDIPFVQSLNLPSVGWRWYQNGYDAEPTDSNFALPHTNYVSHHNGAQYFGYLADNPSQRSNYRGENDFFTDMANNALPPGGGVFYIRGGYYNLNYPQQTPPIQNPNFPNPAGLTTADLATINISKSGDDDHPSYTDGQLSEAMAARVINAIASNPAIWAQSAIIITYDESDGFYDHVPPRILSYGPDGLPQSRGVRIPMILISPFAYAHAVSHAEGDHNSVIETINAIFNRPALSQLPDEAQALAQGNSPAFNQFGPPGFQQLYLGPRDTNSAITDSLLSGFDPEKLLGQTPPLPASYAMIPNNVINSFPHYGGQGCSAIGITPVDQVQGIVNYIPPGFNSLPSTLPAYSHFPLVAHDFNGDGMSDIAWRDTSGDNAIWLMNGSTLSSSAGLGTIGTAWSIVGQRDFNGDGMADLLWHDTSGDLAMWFMNGATVTSGVGLGTVNPVWSIVATGDFNGDGKGDILWRDTSGDIAMWLMNGSTILSSAGLGSLSTAWSVVGTGDFNRDGKSDVLWQDTSGDIAIWFMNGTTVTSVVGLGTIAPPWAIAGTGDFNGDGYADILWRNTSTGAIAVWLMNGSTVLQAAGLGSLATTWSVAEIGDFNGAGKSDILWHDTSGDSAIWFMNGTTMNSGVGLGTIATSWSIQGAGAD